MIFKWSKGNAKLRKSGIIGFGIPAFRSADGFVTCPKAGICAAVCYARQGHYAIKGGNVAKAREHNLSLLRSRSMKRNAQDIIGDLSRMQKVRRVRIHDSGDFYSQAYLDMWAEVARAFPRVAFYSYSKSLHLDFSALPYNFRVVQSEGGNLDNKIDRTKPHARIFTSHAARKVAGYSDGSQTDYLAYSGRGVRIGLVYHGVANLTDAQKQRLG